MVHGARKQHNHRYGRTDEKRQVRDREQELSAPRSRVNADDYSFVAREERDRLRIQKQDPLNQISKSVDELKRKRDDETKTSTPSVQRPAIPVLPASSSSSRLEQLRAARYVALSSLLVSHVSFRLKRESAERSKTDAYLSRVFTGSDPVPDTPVAKPVETDERKRRYNSQYNPDVAKQNTKYATTHDMNWREHY